MRSVIISIVFLCCLSVALTVPACLAASFCQACSTTTTTNCDSCYSWGTGTVAKDKAWTSTSVATCTATMATAYKVVDCQINRDAGITMNVSTATVLATWHPRCAICDNKKYLSYATTAVAETCSDTVPTAMATCAEISNCMQTVCQTTAALAFCHMCNSGYLPTGWNTTYSQYTTCTSYTTASILNCADFSAASSVTNCAACSSGFAVASTGLTCTAFTTDENCMTLNSAGTCYMCFYGYYFSGATCTKQSFALVFALASFVITIFLQ